MDSRGDAPIACTLQSGSYHERLAWVAQLARDGLLGMSRNDLQIELTYALSVADRVREMVSKEQECCAFLNFEVSETGEDVRLTITAPERAREVADSLFEPFVPAAFLQVTLTCPKCSTEHVEVMPTDRCVYFFECQGCRTLLKPRKGDCCVFCSYGDRQCPPRVQGCC